MESGSQEAVPPVICDVTTNSNELCATLQFYTIMTFLHMESLSVNFVNPSSSLLVAVKMQRCIRKTDLPTNIRAQVYQSLPNSFWGKHQDSSSDKPSCENLLDLNAKENVTFFHFGA